MGYERTSSVTDRNGTAGLTLTGDFELVIGGRQSWIPIELSVC
jgi:hypothetical protein